MLRLGENRLFIAEGKGGHTRIVPVSPRFFTTLAAAHLDLERHQGVNGSSVRRAQRPAAGSALSAAGLDEIVAGARRRAGIPGAGMPDRGTELRAAPPPFVLPHVVGRGTAPAAAPRNSGNHRCSSMSRRVAHLQRCFRHIPLMRNCCNAWVLRSRDVIAAAKTANEGGPRLHST